MPRFSFIVSVHNSETFLPECIDSILAQSFDDFEVVAVDDASIDASVEVLREYAAADQRVWVIQLSENVGAGGARNAALKHATGDYVWCLDSDDWIVPGALAAVARELEARGPEVLL